VPEPRNRRPPRPGAKKAPQPSHVRRAAQSAPPAAATTATFMRQMGDLLRGAGDMLHDRADQVEEGEPP
jgi:hypothetical protein